jgi:hypothetical protein
LDFEKEEFGDETGTAAKKQNAYVQFPKEYIQFWKSEKST